MSEFLSVASAKTRSFGKQPNILTMRRPCRAPPHSSHIIQDADTQSERAHVLFKALKGCLRSNHAGLQVVSTVSRLRERIRQALNSADCVVQVDLTDNRFPLFTDTSHGLDSRSNATLQTGPGFDNRVSLIRGE